MSSCGPSAGDEGAEGMVKVQGLKIYLYSTYENQKRMKEDLLYYLGDFGTALLRRFPAEVAHHIGMRFLASPLFKRMPKLPLPMVDVGLTTRIPGIGDLPHPIGLAAGFDKNCLCPESFADLGFAFLEIGTVTPLPQPGNPKPRVFRQSGQRTLINRMGFNSDGGLMVAQRLKRLQWDHEVTPLGVNCGKNKATESEHAVFDYLNVIQTFKDLAQFFVINISSPNTPGLRSLATPDFVQILADQLHGRLHQIWIKLDPDLDRISLQRLIECAASNGFQGVILTNTHRVDWPESGGLSGHSLLSASNKALEWAYEVHKGGLQMIASGGVLTGADVFEKIWRGALGVEVYTGLVYRGPFVVNKLLYELEAEMKLRGFKTLDECRGQFYE